MRHACWFLILFLAGCGNRSNNSETDSLSGEKYENKELGWSIEIPEGWEVISTERLQEQTQKGLDHVSETVGAKIDASEIKYLVGFQKDEYNSFQSTIEPFNEGEDGSWEETQALVREVLYDTYSYKGIKTDTATSIETIDGLAFQRFRIDVYSPLGNVVLTQDLYSRLINGYSLGIVLNYNNEGDREILKKILNNSRFQKTP
jgi:hypothetical protein